MLKSRVEVVSLVKIDKLVHGGQGLGVLPDGRKVFVWNSLAGEKVKVNLTKSKKDYAEGVAIEIIEPSVERIEPKDELYLSTSPWQIMTYGAENIAKQQILNEVFEREKVDYQDVLDFKAPKNEWAYRNKMEYSFYGDEDGLHLALFNRGTHQKQIVDGSSIARPEIDQVANKVCRILDQAKVRAGDLKSIILRCGSGGEVVCAIFTKNPDFKQLDLLKNVCKGLAVVYSNPKSPASVRTKDLFIYGDITLCDEFLGHKITYDVFSFFQVNLEIFENALAEINAQVGESAVIDMYSGVGTIGLCLKNPKALVEVDNSNIAHAKNNSEGRKNVEVIQSSSEKALDYITGQDVLIVDPPRAGLHKDLIAKVLDIKPPKIVYLSCNPSTQARDLKVLEQVYKIDKLIGYNFFPRTPHIEALAVLSLK